MPHWLEREISFQISIRGSAEELLSFFFHSHASGTSGVLSSRIDPEMEVLKFRKQLMCSTLAYEHDTLKNDWLE